MESRRDDYILWYSRITEKELCDPFGTAVFLGILCCNISSASRCLEVRNVFALYHLREDHEHLEI